MLLVVATIVPTTGAQMVAEFVQEANILLITGVQMEAVLLAAVFIHLMQ